MKLNEDSIKELNDVNKVVRKNYYFWIDDNDRLTVTLVDDQDKTLQECIGITMDTINKLMSQQWGTDLPTERPGSQYEVI